MEQAFVKSACAAAAALLLTGGHVGAGIVCNGSYQVVGASEISTPYCRDKNLAEYARERGVRVSDAEIRNNPNKKEEVCRLVGRSTRVSDACNSDSDSSRSK